MPLTRIEIENTNGRWIAECELGGITARRVVVRDDDFDAMLRGISAAHHQHQGTEDPLAANKQWVKTYGIADARAEIKAQAIEQAPYGRKADGTPRKKPGRAKA